MFEELTGKFDDALKTLRGQDRITETNIEPAIRIVKKALLDADVNLAVAKEFLLEVKQKAVGIDVVRGITPEQKFIEIVHTQLVDVMGGANEPIAETKQGTTVIMLVGLQGAGKTTAAAKLGLHLKEKGKNVLLVAADTFRPAAKDQLLTLGKQIKIDVYTGHPDAQTLEIACQGVEKAKKENYHTVIIDTAGRLYIDKELMSEIVLVRKSIEPDEVLLVVDSMIGQEAAELTRVFDQQVGLTGAILTKLDGDSRGGAALSIRKVSGKAIKFIGTGEKVEALEPFYPDRFANRILGMGDILTLVDRAQKEVDIGDMMTMQKKFEEATFDFTDFLKQMQLIKRMGSIGGLIKLIPGMNRVDDSTLKKGEIQLKKIQAMINSMTSEEQKQPEILMKSQKRRKRIAAGSGYNISEVEKVILDFEKMRGMMQSLTKGNLGAIQDTLMKNTNLNRNEDSNKESLLKTTRKKTFKQKKGFFQL